MKESFFNLRFSFAGEGFIGINVDWKGGIIILLMCILLTPFC